MSSATSPTEPSQPQAVRFASVNQEIEPAHSIQSLSTVPSNISGGIPEFSPEAQEEIRNLSRSLQSSPLQQRRMNHFAFEPVSLPTSRVSESIFELVLKSCLFANQALCVTAWWCLYGVFCCRIGFHVIQKSELVSVLGFSFRFCPRSMQYITRR